MLIGLALAGWWLVAARGVQGTGAAIVAPSSLSLLTASFPAGRDRAKAVALYGATAGVGASLGLVIGGALADWVSWRAGFFINVPIGAAMIMLALRYLPASARARGRFDLVGATCATLGVGAVVYRIIHSAESGWGAPITVIPLGLGGLLIATLAVTEGRVAQPVMPLRLFAIPRLTARFGQAVPLTAGIVMTLAGMAWLAQVTPTSSYWTAVALPMVLIGAGQGLAFAPLTSAGISGVSAADAGAASGLVNTFHQLGMALGLGVLVAVSAGSGRGLTTAAAVLSAHVHTALSAGSVLLAGSLLAALGLILPADQHARR